MKKPITAKEEAIDDDFASYLQQINQRELNWDNRGLTLSTLSRLKDFCYLISLSISLNQLEAAATEILLSLPLTSLDISYNRLGDTGMQLLAKHPTLRKLNVAGNQLSKQGVISLPENNRLVELNISTNQLGDEGAISLSHLLNLQVLIISGIALRDTGMEAIAAMPLLSVLDLKSNLITDKSALLLAQHPMLAKVDVRSTKVKKPAAQLIQKNVQVNLDNMRQQRQQLTMVTCYLALLYHKHHSASLFKLPIEVIYIIYGYLTMPILYERFRPADELAKFVFEHSDELALRLQLKNEAMLRLTETSTANLSQSTFSFFKPLPTDAMQVCQDTIEPGPGLSIHPDCA